MEELMQNQHKDADEDKVEHVVPFKEILRKALNTRQQLSYKGSGKDKQTFSLGTVLDFL